MSLNVLYTHTSYYIYFWTAKAASGCVYTYIYTTKHKGIILLFWLTAYNLIYIYIHSYAFHITIRAQ